MEIVILYCFFLIYLTTVCDHLRALTVANTGVISSICLHIPKEYIILPDLSTRC